MNDIEKKSEGIQSNGLELKQNLTTFLTHLDSIKDTLPMTMVLIEPYTSKAKDKFLEFLKKHVKEIENEEGIKGIGIKYEKAKIFESLAKNSQISSLASNIIPESLFVALISQFDAFINRLLHILFKIRPEYINNSERNLMFSELVNFESIEEARSYIIEKEVESVFRRSHTEHFQYLENKLGIPLRTNLPIWERFIEITERRNLFVHCDGMVTNQYIKVCTENKCNIEDAELNKRLNISSKYFSAAYECLFELSVKLTHTIWRKLLKEDIGNADRGLNSICYELLHSRQFKLADTLLEFACNQTRFFNDLSKNIFIVNKALSKYLQGQKKGALEIINSKDWSASSDDFKLAHLVLNEKFEDCYTLMVKIGKSGEVDIESYRTWPLFNKLRKEEKFKSIYKEIFNEEYMVLEIPKRPVQELIEKVIENNPDIKERVVEKDSIRKKKKIKRVSLKQDNAQT